MEKTKIKKEPWWQKLLSKLSRAFSFVTTKPSSPKPATRLARKRVPVVSALKNVVAGKRKRVVKAKGPTTPAKLTPEVIAAIEADQGVKLERPDHNPILKPLENNLWETRATFNPAAAVADGKVHLIYRAVGDDDISVLGYACSHDGLHIHERLAEPAYYARRKPDHTGPKLEYGSGGGGSGGCEDPRLTFIDDVAYLLYTAFDGWGSIRIALTSLSLKDFLNKRWNWTDPILISRPGEIQKNWVLFPEKINGKYIILSSISPKIKVHTFKSMDELREKEKYIDSEYVKSSRRKAWDSWVRGAGPPPIKTPHGWLLLYHAMDHRDPDRYKLGAMILDLEDPTKVLYRSNGPILEPDECYENEGFKAGVVYACGAVVIDGQLFVYYGGADTVTCVATANLEDFMNCLMSDQTPKLKGVVEPKRKPQQQRYVARPKVKKEPHPVA